jgi:hypothetical protein
LKWKNNEPRIWLFEFFCPKNKKLVHSENFKFAETYLWPYFQPLCSKNFWRCTTLEDHISRSTWPIWTRVGLLERPYSLLLGKKLEIGIYRHSPILEPYQCSVGYNFFGRDFMRDVKGHS